MKIIIRRNHISRMLLILVLIASLTNAFPSRESIMSTLRSVPSPYLFPSWSPPGFKSSSFLSPMSKFKLPFRSRKQSSTFERRSSFLPDDGHNGGHSNGNSNQNNNDRQQSSNHHNYVNYQGDNYHPNFEQPASFSLSTSFESTNGNSPGTVTRNNHGSSPGHGQDTNSDNSAPIEIIPLDSALSPYNLPMEQSEKSKESVDIKSASLTVLDGPTYHSLNHQGSRQPVTILHDKLIGAPKRPSPQSVSSSISFGSSVVSNHNHNHNHHNNDHNQHHNNHNNNNQDLSVYKPSSQSNHQQSSSSHRPSLMNLHNNLVESMSWLLGNGQQSQSYSGSSYSNHAEKKRNQTNHRWPVIGDQRPSLIDSLKESIKDSIKITETLNGVGSDEHPVLFQNNHGSIKSPFLQRLKLTTSPFEHDLLGETSPHHNYNNNQGSGSHQESGHGSHGQIDRVDAEDNRVVSFWSTGGSSSPSSDEVESSSEDAGQLLYRPQTTTTAPTTLYPPYLTSPRTVAIITKRRNPVSSNNNNNLPSFMVSTSYDSTGAGYGSGSYSANGGNRHGTHGNKYGQHNYGGGIITSSGLIKTNTINTHKNNHIHVTNSISSNIFKSPHSPPKVSTPVSIVSVVSKPPIKVASVQGNKYKDPDDIQSGTLTVIDNDPIVVSNGSKTSFDFGGSGSGSWNRRNLTIVHDKLIVAYKPGRPPPSHVFPSSAPAPAVSSVGSVHPVNPIKDDPFTTRKPYNFTGSMEWILGSGSDTNGTTPEPDTVSTYFPTIGYPIRDQPNQGGGGNGFGGTVTYPPHRVTSPWPTYDPNILNDFTTPTSMATADSQPVTVTYITTTPTTSTTGRPTSSSTMTYPSVSSESSSGHSEVIAIVTKRPYFPSATVNAILAPPIPSRPLSTPAPLGNTGIFSNILSLAGISGPGGIMNRLTLLKTALFTLLVMFLPPLTLAAAVAQLL